MKLVAFCPEILKDEYSHVFSVMVPSGEVTERIWLEALSCKVNNMLCKFRSPEKVAAWVCRALDCVHTDDPDELGFIIVERNYLLLQMINLYRDPPVESFPVFVDESDPDVSEDAVYDNLYTWVQDMAYFIGNNTYDAFCRHSTPPDEYDHLNPDKDIKPYIDFIDNNLEVKSDPESDVNKIGLFSNLHDFGYDLSYKYGCVRFETGLWPPLEVRFDSINDLNNLMKKFNSNHASKISYDGIEEHEGPSRKYLPSLYLLRLDFPLLYETKNIINSIMTFYSDLYSLCSDNQFEKLVSGPYSEQSLVFLLYLRKEISYLKVLQIDPKLIKW